MSILILLGGFILASFVPSREILKWRDIGYYSIFGFILLIGQLSLFLSRRKYYLSLSENNQLENEASAVPTSSTFSKKASFRGSRSSVPKEAVQIDETAVSYCPSCGKSFTSKYKFCPNCGSCKISSFY